MKHDNEWLTLVFILLTALAAGLLIVGFNPPDTTESEGTATCSVIPCRNH
jgi:hypothetical protein